MTRYRPSIPDRVKLLVVLRQEGKCGCGCGEKLGTLVNTEFDHCPPLALREYDEAARKYTPDANDPAKIVARVKHQHREKTNHPRGPHTSIDSDQHAIAKTRPHRSEKFIVRKPDLGVPRDLIYEAPSSHSKKRPFPGSRASGWKKPMNGKAERRNVEPE